MKKEGGKWEISTQISVKQPPHRSGQSRLTASPGPACADRSCDEEAAAGRCPPGT